MTIEQRIIKHIQKVLKCDFKDAKEKILIVKLSRGLTDYEMGYVYSVAAEAKRIYGCLIIFAFDEDTSAIKTFDDYLGSISTQGLNTIRKFIDHELEERKKNAPVKPISQDGIVPSISFAFIDISD